MTYFFVADRKQAEQELRASEAAMRSLYKVTSASKLSFDQRLQGLLALGRRHFGLDMGLIGCMQERSYQVIAVQTPPRFAFPIDSGEVFNLDKAFYCKALYSKEPYE